MIRNSSEPGYLSGQFLAAMPAMGDPRFEKSVIYVCAHSEDGAMGLVINQPLEELKFPDILDQMGIEPTPACDQITVHCGGPVESARGFVLHSSDYQMDGTLVVDESIALSATTEILKAIAYGTGPKQSLMALGYAGWGAGQLDEEILNNAWLNVPGDGALLWATQDETKWDTALSTLGISPAMLVADAGHA
ncbi:MAG: YqgE/AlgH family protein [Alphaproteobacteria bacterium]|nr:YqgE/AlgH family protein [Alphaproteobacteria bacterium]